MNICSCHQWARDEKIREDKKFSFHHPRCDLYRSDDLVTADEYNERLKDPLDAFWRSEILPANTFRPEIILIALEALSKNSEQHLNALTSAEMQYLEKILKYFNFK